MTIEELKREKHNLETEIKDAIQRFIDTTGLIPTDILYDYSSRTISTGGREIVVNKELNLKVRLHI